MTANGAPAKDAYRPYRVESVADESATIRSFRLTPVDNRLPDWRPGQFLPIRVRPPGAAEPLRRTYTISTAPGDGVLRLSIKREEATRAGLPPGAVSGFLHGSTAPGAVIEAMAPRGSFTFDAVSPRPAVLLSAGIGITPVLAMLRHAAREARRGGPVRPIRFVHGARDGRELAFLDEIRDATAAHPAFRAHVSLSAPTPGDLDQPGVAGQGRIDMGLLHRLLPFDDYDFYLCGPAGFMQTLYDGLREAGVPNRRILAEAFGPASLMRRHDGGPRLMPATAGGTRADPVTVRFVRSGVEAVWTPDQGTLLDLAEASGLKPPFSCRAGACCTCALPLRAGAVDYVNPPAVDVPQGMVLTCSAVPKVGSEGESAKVELDL